MGFDMITLVLFKDESVSWIQRGKATPSWTREESLKSISTIQLIDLPTDQSTNIDPYNWSFSQRLSIQVQLLRSYLSTLLAEIETGAFFQPKTRDPLINESGLIRDQFNLHKIIFVVTKSGNAYGLDSLDGDVIWKVSLDEDMNGQNCKISSIVQKDTNINFGVVVVISKCEHGMSLTKIDPVTGQVTFDKDADQSITGKLLRVEAMEQTNADNQHPLILFTEVDDATRVTIYGGDDHDRVRSEVENTIYWFFNSNKSSIQGMKIILDVGTYNGKADQVWTFQAPSNQHIANVVAPDRPHVVHSQGKPLADRSVLYKYLNPNMIAVLSHTTEADNVELMLAYLYILDAYTGKTQKVLIFIQKYFRRSYTHVVSSKSKRRLQYCVL